MNAWHKHSMNTGGKSSLGAMCQGLSGWTPKPSSGSSHWSPLGLGSTPQLQRGVTVSCWVAQDRERE